MDKGTTRMLMIIVFFSFSIYFFWDSVPLLSESVSKVFDPSFGRLINWNNSYGLLIVICILTFFMTLVHKYGTDQKILKELRKEQKEIKKEARKYRDNPEKAAEFLKKDLGFFPKVIKHQLKANVIIMVPLILFFRWFMDFFVSIGSPALFGIFNWIMFYFVFSIISSMIFRKIMNVA